MQAMKYDKGRDDERERRRTSTRMAGVLMLTVALCLLGFIAARSVAASTTRSNATVSLRKTNLGMILVNARGHTIYLFAKDRKGKSSCNGSCARFWPPVISKSTPIGGSGIKPSLLGRTRRSNGTMQVTYNKHPLYTYALDKRAGQTKGEGSSFFGAKWWAVSASGRAVVKASTTSTTTTMATTTSPCPYLPCP
jgi:predicted lipoprotein with Yx(FWY)xxD motif